MFREMRRFKQVLSQEECIEVLKNEPRGVLSLIGRMDIHTESRWITGIVRKMENFIFTVQKKGTNWMH